MKAIIQRVDLDRRVPVPGLAKAFGYPVQFATPAASGWAVLALDRRALEPRLAADHPDSILHRPIEVGIGHALLENARPVVAREDVIKALGTDFDYYIESSHVRVSHTCEVFITVGDWVIASKALRAHQLPEDGQALGFTMRGLSFWVY